MTKSKQREWLAKTIAEGKAIGIQVRWHSEVIVVLGCTDGDEQKDDHQPLHGEAGEQGRSSDRPEQGPRLGEDATRVEKEVEQGQG